MSKGRVGASPASENSPHQTPSERQDNERPNWTSDNAGLGSVSGPTDRNITNTSRGDSSRSPEVQSSNVLGDHFNALFEERLAILEQSIVEGVQVNNEQSVQKEYFTKEEILEKFGEEVYTLLQGDFTETKTLQAYLISRQNAAFLFTVQSSACLVIDSKVFVLDVKTEAATMLLSSILGGMVTTRDTNLRTRTPSIEDSAATEDCKDGDQENNPKPLRFTLLELVFATAFFQLNVEHEPLLKEKRALSSPPVDKVSRSTFERIDKMKAACQELKSKATAVKDLLVEIEANKSMLFQLDLGSRFPVIRDDYLPEEEHSEDEGSSRKRVKEEAEEMLRYFKQRAGIVKLEAKRLYGHACIFEDSSKLTVAMLNYHASKFRVKLSIGALVAACGAFIASLFGIHSKGPEFDMIRWVFLLSFVFTFLLLFLSVKVFSWKKD